MTCFADDAPEYDASEVVESIETPSQDDLDFEETVQAILAIETKPNRKERDAVARFDRWLAKQWNYQPVS